MSVKRYKIVETTYGNGDISMELHLTENGDLVEYDDYEKLEAEFSALKKKLEWIPVSEQLPEYSEKELVLARSSGELLIPVLDGVKYTNNTAGLHRAMKDLKSTEWRYLSI